MSGEPRRAGAAWSQPRLLRRRDDFAVQADVAEHRLAAVRVQFKRAGKMSESNAVAFLLRYLFTYQQMTQKIGLLSGGERSRLQLALLVLSGANFLLLDEPTNNLDITSAEVLENALDDFVGTVLVISHDRYFLDNTVDTIWEMSRTGIEVYQGNYSAYLLQRQERWEYKERVFKEEKERLLKEADYVQRNWVRASTHAQALGRLRRLSRDLAVVETYGLMALRSGRKWSESRMRNWPAPISTVPPPRLAG